MFRLFSLNLLQAVRHIEFYIQLTRSVVYKNRFYIQGFLYAVKKVNRTQKYLRLTAHSLKKVL
jgi:hypothetical protein